MKMASLDAFTTELASKAPVPGGGGASALAGALAASLASMVCALTSGKKRYAAYQSDIERIAERAEALRREMLCGIDEDAASFAPLAKAYSIPKDDPERDTVMEAALLEACQAPIAIMRRCAEVVELTEELAEKGSSIAISDAGAAAILARSAILGASLNVFINCRSMKDAARAGELRSETETLVNEYAPRAERVFEKVLDRLKGE